MDSTSRTIRAESSLQFDGLLNHRKLRDVLRPADKLLAPINLSEGKDVDLGAEPTQALGALDFRTEALQPMNLVDKIDDSAIAQVGDGVRADGSALLVADVDDAHVLPRGKIDPEVGV